MSSKLPSIRVYTTFESLQTLMDEENMQIEANERQDAKERLEELVAKIKKMEKKQKRKYSSTLFTEYDSLYTEPSTIPKAHVRVHVEDIHRLKVKEECINGQHEVDVKVRKEEDEDCYPEKYRSRVYMTCLEIARALRSADPPKRLCDHKEMDAEVCRKRRKIDPNAPCDAQDLQWKKDHADVTPGERHCLLQEESAILDGTYCPHVSSYPYMFRERQPNCTHLVQRQECVICQRK